MDEQSKDPWDVLHGYVRMEDDRVSWTRETTRMKVDGGWLYKTSTEHYNKSGIVTACSDALAFVPNVKPQQSKR